MSLNNNIEMNQFSSRYLVAEFINYRLCKHGMRWENCPTFDLPPSQIQLKLRSLGDEFEERFRTQFDAMVNQLHITEATAYPTFQTVVEELFLEGTVNWGRIVALFGFGGALSVACVQKGMPQLVDSIVDWVSTYICTNLDQWITSNGGWQGFVEFYNQGQNHNDSPWGVSGLVKYGAIGVLGAMALGALLQRT